MDMSHADSAAQRQQKRAVLSQALLELQSFPNLLQCYNAAYYFVTNSTAPRPVAAVGTAVCSDNNSIMSTADPHQQNATVEMAITPAGKVSCLTSCCFNFWWSYSRPYNVLYKQRRFLNILFVEMIFFLVFIHILTVLEGLDCCEQLASTLALTLAVTAATHPVQLRGTFPAVVFYF